MNKIKVLLKAPVLVQSGYSVHSRQIFRALFSDPSFDVYVENIRWGGCSFLTEDSPEKDAIKQCIQKYVLAKHQGQTNFDLFVHVTIPNEWEKLGKVNVGVTAGIEVDRVSHVWVQKANEMDLVIVPSAHSKKVYEQTTVDWQNQRTGETGTLKVNTPIVVCHEGVDTDIFHPHLKASGALAHIDFEPDFNFLHVGQWGKGSFGEDRKNISNLVRYFIEAFKGRNDVGLVLKLNMARNSIADLEIVKNRLNAIKSNFNPDEVPPIYLLHGNLTNEEMASLYNHPKIKAFVSLTHGEGFGLPLLEAAACELPVIATNWSGHLDFLKKGKFSAVDYNLVPIPEIAEWENILIKGSRWAEVQEEDVKRRLKKMVSSYSLPKDWAKELSEKIHEEFNLDQVCETFTDTVKQLLISKSESKGLASPLEILQKEVDTAESYNILYTMPRSAGDVYISTAVIDGLMKDVREAQPDAKLYFATSPEYFDILKGNPNVHKVIPWRDFMMTVELCEEVFDLVLNPHTQTQYVFSNYVRRGNGRLLAEEYANYCQSPLGEYFLDLSDVEEPSPLLEDYMTVHAGSGKDRWAARKYEDWKEVLTNLKSLYPNLKIVQVGGADEALLDDVDVNLLGKTDYHQLGAVLKNSLLHLGIDSFPMHLAVSLDTPTVSVFGCSTPSSSGPWSPKKDAKYILLESDRKTCGCTRPCYKDSPKNQAVGYAPINEIDPQTVFKACEVLLRENESA